MIPQRVLREDRRSVHRYTAAAVADPAGSAADADHAAWGRLLDAIERHPRGGYSGSRLKGAES